MAWVVMRGVLQGLAMWWSEHPEVPREQVVATAMNALWVGFERDSAGSLGRSARPARIEALDLPAPGRLLPGREVVVVAAGQGLERDERRVVFEEDRGFPLAASTAACVARRTTLSQPEASAGRASRRPRPSRAERRRSSTWVKAVVRRPEAVRCGPAATAQLSRRQRRKSTGTSGRPPAARPGGRRGGERPHQARQRPAVGRHQRVVAAGVGEARRAGDPAGDRARRARGRRRLRRRPRRRRSRPAGAARPAPPVPPARRWPIPAPGLSRRRMAPQARRRRRAPGATKVRILSGPATFCLHVRHGGKPVQPLRRPG